MKELNSVIYLFCKRERMKPLTSFRYVIYRHCGCGDAESAATSWREQTHDEFRSEWTSRRRQWGFQESKSLSPHLGRRESQSRVWVPLMASSSRSTAGHLDQSDHPDVFVVLGFAVIRQFSRGLCIQLPPQSRIHPDGSQTRRRLLGTWLHNNEWITFEWMHNNHVAWHGRWAFNHATGLGGAVNRMCYICLVIPKTWIIMMNSNYHLKVFITVKVNFHIAYVIRITFFLWFKSNRRSTDNSERRRTVDHNWPHGGSDDSVGRSDHRPGLRPASRHSRRGDSTWEQYGSVHTYCRHHSSTQSSHKYVAAPLNYHYYVELRHSLTDRRRCW